MFSSLESYRVGRVRCFWSESAWVEKKRNLLCMQVLVWPTCWLIAVPPPPLMGSLLPSKNWHPPIAWTSQPFEAWCTKEAQLCSLVTFQSEADHWVEKHAKQSFSFAWVYQTRKQESLAIACRIVTSVVLASWVANWVSLFCFLTKTIGDNVGLIANCQNMSAEDSESKIQSDLAFLDTRSSPSKLRDFNQGK